MAILILKRRRVNNLHVGKGLQLNPNIEYRNSAKGKTTFILIINIYK